MSTATTPTCSNCGNDPGAPCAGHPGCHGYYEGCDCPDCRATYLDARRGGPLPVDPRDLRDAGRGPFAPDDPTEIDS